jgi:hypothetical protein
MRRMRNGTIGQNRYGGKLLQSHAIAYQRLLREVDSRRLVRVDRITWLCYNLPIVLIRRGGAMDAPLANPISDLEDSYGVVVIGSGYGGAIVGARLAQGRSLCILERGCEWIPGTFPDNFDDMVKAVRVPHQPPRPLSLSHPSWRRRFCRQRPRWYVAQ